MTTELAAAFLVGVGVIGAATEVVEEGTVAVVVGAPVTTMGAPVWVETTEVCLPVAVPVVVGLSAAMATEAKARAAAM